MGKKEIKELKNQKEGLLFDLKLKQVVDGKKTATYNPNIKVIDAEIKGRQEERKEIIEEFEKIINKLTFGNVLRTNELKEKLKELE